MARILVVDNDEGLVHFLRRLFAKAGHDVASCTDGMAALATLRQESFDAILLDYKMPGLNGLETLSEIKRLQVKTPVIIMTAFGTSETAIEAMKRGAYDYLLKPFDTEELKRITADALQVSRLMREVVTLPESITRVSPAADELRLVGNNRKIQEVFKLIGQVAPKDVTVLITGESGTGKELVARAIYHHSHRADKPFMAVNCAAIPETRKRAVRLRARGIHGGRPDAPRQVRTLPPRHAVLRRNRRYVAVHPGQGAPGTSGGRVRAIGRHGARAHGRPHSGRHE